MKSIIIPYLRDRIKARGITGMLELTSPFGKGRIRRILLLASVLLLSSLTAGCQFVGSLNVPTIAAGGNVLNLEGVDPQTLDPAISGDADSQQYISQIFSGLVALDDNLQPVPDIARDWQISPDGKTYTFHLRHDVKFQNGKPVKAQDFKYSWERAANPATGSQTAANYLGDIVGVRAELAGNATGISGVKVIDDYTLQVAIDAPKSYFLYKLTYPTAFVVDSSNVQSGKDWWKNPNGTGPFKLKTWQQGQQLILEKNSLYYGRVPQLDSVVYHIYSGVPIDLYETGQIDAAGVDVADIERASDPAGPFAGQLSITPELSLSYIGFNTTKPPFDDPKIRRAFALAVDKNKLASLVFKDMVQPADGILPPGMPGFNKNLSGLPYDVAEAKKLIAESKYGSAANLPPITITTAGRGAEIPHYLEALVYEWQQNLGVTVKVRELEPEYYYYHLKQETDEMFDMGWIADYPHPEDFLDLLFRSGSENNYGGYSNPQLDALLARADTEMDQTKSFTLYQQAEQMLVNDAAVIPLWFGRNYILVKPYVKGYTLNPMGMVALNRVTVEAH